MRIYHRRQVRQTLNSFAPFRDPALEIQFPQTVASNERNKSILAAGVQNGVWVLRQGARNPNVMEIILTDQGNRWFSVVEKRIIATFKVGSREATAVTALSEIFPSRQIRFQYHWNQFHPAAVILGDRLPEAGREYAGEAVLFYENDHWRLMDWKTPEFDSAVEQFKQLETAQ